MPSRPQWFIATLDVDGLTLVSAFVDGAVVLQLHAFGPLETLGAVSHLEEYFELGLTDYPRPFYCEQPYNA